jgi:hypothetical protein
VGLGYSGEVQDKLNEFSKPVEHWTDNPDQYFIIRSDAEEE